MSFYPVKIGYEAARGALLGFQYTNPSKSSLLFIIQKISTLFEAAFLVSDYVDLYNSFEEGENKPWYQKRDFLFASTVCGLTLISFIAVPKINQAFRSTINLAGLVPNLDPKTALQWEAPRIHRILQGILLNRALVNLIPAVIKRDIGKGILAISQMLALGGFSSSKWIRVDQSIDQIKGTAKFYFHINFMENLQGEVQAISDYSKNCFKKGSISLWKTVTYRTFFGSLVSTGQVPLNDFHFVPLWRRLSEQVHYQFRAIIDTPNLNSSFLVVEEASGGGICQNGWADLTILLRSTK